MMKVHPTIEADLLGGNFEDLRAKVLETVAPQLAAFERNLRGAGFSARAIDQAMQKARAVCFIHAGRLVEQDMRNARIDAGLERLN